MTDISTAPAHALSSISEVANPDSAHPTATTKPQNNKPQKEIPPPKTDKPRPHVCTTCSRSFARLEHLKRHERSHTKEKPFECPDCTRCFARRDLLLRHQQKLHMTTTPSSRPRNARRESTSGSRVRKNSIAGNNGTMRPRANTISHVGGGSVGMMASAINAPAKPPTHGHSRHPSLSSIPIHNLNIRSMGNEGHQHPASGLSKLNTTGISMGMSESLRTAPVFGSYDSSFGMGDLLLGNTINPAQLHFNGSPDGLGETPASYSAMPRSNTQDNGLDNGFEWFPFDTPMQFPNESAIDGSSPSAMSTGSQSGISESMLDGSNAMTSAGQWSSTIISSHAQSLPTQINLDFSASMFPEFYPQDTVSPKSLVGQGQMADMSLNTPNPAMGTVVPGVDNMFSHSTAPTGNVPAAHFDTFGQNSYFGVQSQPEYLSSINDATRQALMTTLRQPSGLNHRRFSQQPSNPSVTSPGASSRSNSFFETNSYTLPSTPDLQRYIAAYVNYFHPHFPFLHIPTLNFSVPDFFSNNKKTSGSFDGSSSVSGGGGCLILSMAAIGALFEFNTATSKELFHCAKKMIQLYLEERRKADVTAALNRPDSGRDGANTPLWLVQAMLLNVIYGHHCDDKTSAEIASTHCAALVSLARAAELTVPHPPESVSPDLMDFTSPNGDVKMDDFDSWTGSPFSKEHKDWLHWKDIEERKRTLYAIFMLSSLLVSAYNHAPALTNSEVRLSLPCDEQLWSAESPQVWMALGGTADMEQHSVKFSDALKVLLMASQQSKPANQSGLSVDTLRPSSFGCMVLINALHNYIWETRQQHMGKQWTYQETEAMHVHIEPALRAWQTVWSSNPEHRVERPNPFGLGPLSADCIPLLDLAYIRLYVNLGRTKEAFWQRDWDGMADELSRAAEVAPNATGSPMSDFGLSNPGDTNAMPQDLNGDFSLHDVTLSTSVAEHAPRSRPSKNERHLRKAAFYAADSLCMSDKFGNTYAQSTSRELPIQSAMCTFDCAQVLAEWAATVQDRVGIYLGIIGQGPMDLNQVSAMMLLEEEDCALLRKIEEFLASMEAKMKSNMSLFGSSGHEAYNSPPSMVEGGYSTKVLFAAAYLLSRAGVWKVTKLCAQALEHEGVRMRERAQRSVSSVVS